MTSQRDQQRRALAELRELVGLPLDTGQIFRRADEVLRGALGYDGVCWHGTDPATGLVTSVLTDDLQLEDFRQAVELEIWTEDVSQFADLRRSSRDAESLSRATRGRPGTSRRFREQIAPAGFGDELRALFDSAGASWGCAAFMRAPERGAFRPGEVALAERAARVLGVALRSSQLRAAGTSEGGHPPAVLLLDSRNRVVRADDRAEALLREIADDAVGVFQVPTSLLMAVEQARSAQAAARVAPRLRVRTHTGAWLVLSTSIMGSGADHLAAVVITPATAADVMPVVFATYGLTVREREVALHVLRGSDTREIARVLSLTPLTVQDHLKSVFTKAGVRSRRDFVAHLIASQVPEIWD
ncbi:helix-turn-helix transcriptional regulator [Streptomyces liangshanensis]|uniref:Helix-turn-helix transcriptional regulator n=1 Tax=Streptomyces liangshanensis TaxID=2717324 RepID=A0A6G9H2T6_9ACTN|nr:helix-turn-helix transcriptional regulator [Streptomyces liangshanensis]QIQ04774.1 helix-turn-helix transcriptional regulator [Streptomyces liangshanensis]